jgi:hypothetical protein
VVYDDDLLTIFDESAKKWPHDIDAAVAHALAAVKNHECYAAWVDELVARAVREAVHRARHEMTRVAKSSAGDYGGPAKVTGTGRAVLAVYASWYDTFCIGNRTLGDLLGEELDTLASDEDGRARGHAMNARMARWLRAPRKDGTPRVRDGQRVREAVPEATARRAWENIRRGGGEGEQYAVAGH